MPRTVAQLAKEACEVQDACNLVAVVNGMARAIKELRELQDSGGAVMFKGDDALRAHAITRAWADKIASLTGIQDVGNDHAMRAHAECLALSEGLREREALENMWLKPL